MKRYQIPPQLSVRASNFLANADLYRKGGTIDTWKLKQMLLNGTASKYRNFGKKSWWELRIWMGLSKTKWRGQWLK